MLDQITRHNQITLHTLAEQIAGGRGTPRYHAILLWLLDEAQAGRIKLAAESSNHLASTVTEETAAAASAYWAAKQDVLNALRNGTTAAEAATEGARMRDKFDSAQEQAARQAEIGGGIQELAYLFMAYVLRQQAAPEKYLNDAENDTATAAALQGRSLRAYWITLAECYGPIEAPEVAKVSKKRGRE